MIRRSIPLVRDSLPTEGVEFPSMWRHARMPAIHLTSYLPQRWRAVAGGVVFPSRARYFAAVPNSVRVHNGCAFRPRVSSRALVFRIRERVYARLNGCEDLLSGQRPGRNQNVGWAERRPSPAAGEEGPREYRGRTARNTTDTAERKTGPLIERPIKHLE